MRGSHTKPPGSLIWAGALPMQRLPAQTAIRLAADAITGIKLWVVLAVDTGTAIMEIRRSAVPAIMETGRVMDARMVLNLDSHPVLCNPIRQVH